MSFHHLVNTRYFSEAAIGFKKNGRRYTTAPKGSRDYYEYWEEQDRRCMFGYKVADLWIPGRMYFWLNFFPMFRVSEEVMARALAKRMETGKIGITVAEKEQQFPSFWETHYEWWNFKHIAWYGGEFMGIKSEGGQHLGCLKTRGAGWSYLEACDGVYNYNFIPGSKSYYFAGAEPYLQGDAIMDKVQSGLDWINEHCSYWKQNRQVKKSIMHQKASYLDAFGVERGSHSEIIAQIVDKPSKTRGKRGRKASFEEGGSFPCLEDALEVCMGSMRDGSVYVGQISVFGTGGETGPGIQGLENIFRNPAAWDMMCFPNIWEDVMEGAECGYFVPCWRANSFMMDAEGNVDMPAAIQDDDIAREKKQKSGKPKDLDRRKAEYPRTPGEALQRLTGNGFNGDEIDKQILKLQSSMELKGMIRHGKMEYIDGEGVQFVPQPKNIARPIEDYPHKNTKGDGNTNDLTGCVSIIERPFVDQLGKVPPGMYLMTFDPYYKEESIDLTSLWSWKIWKLDNKFDLSFTNVPVAWCAGRPTKYEDNHDRMFKAADFYNCMIQGEIAGGGQSVVTYAKSHRKLHRLCHEPEMAHNKELASKAAGNAYLMNMNTDRKKTGIMYLEDWHMDIRGIDDKGDMIYNVNRIYDIAWLKEMRRYNPEVGNFDRISDALPAMFMLKENYVIGKKARRESKDFYSRSLFGGEESAEQGMTTTY